jgi:hypothetical protein
MKNIQTLDWGRAQADLHAQGYALLPQVLSPADCTSLIEGYDTPDAFRKTIRTERHRFGLGEYKYYRYPLPPAIAGIRAEVYPFLAGVANEWMESLGEATRFPPAHADLLAACRAAGQHLPTPLILRYGRGGFNTLHQDLYGEVYFPLQTVLFLNEPGEDFEGGEFVLTEQVPRAQSKAQVLRPRRGDLLVFTTRFRPVRGARGFYRVNVKHGVSPLLSGVRHTLGIIFHDALT